jgi:rRNA-processing protein FCF1
MAPAPRSALDGIDRVVVDGTNFLYRLGGGTASPPAAIIGRVRAVIPADVEIQLVFDGVGHGVTGRVAQKMHVRWSGRRTGDDVVLELLGNGPADAVRVLVVTDDRNLRIALTLRGARTVPLAWLANRLSIPILSSTAPGNRRPTIGSTKPPVGGGGPQAAAADSRDDERPRWKPGRGATTKTGPGFRVARHKRHPNNPAT